MTKFFIAFGVCAITMLVVDGVWLGVIARNFYKSHLGHLLAERMNWAAAVACYLILVSGLVVFVVEPCVANTSLLRTALLGALFGLVVYGTYDLTNQTLIKDWPLLVTIVDIAWGMFLAAVVSVSGVFFARWWGT